MNWALNLSFNPIMDAEKKGKVIGISLCNQRKLEETIGAPSGTSVYPHLTLFLYTPHFKTL